MFLPPNYKMDYHTKEEEVVRRRGSFSCFLGGVLVLFFEGSKVVKLQQ